MFLIIKVNLLFINFIQNSERWYHCDCICTGAHVYYINIYKDLIKSYAYG